MEAGRKEFENRKMHRKQVTLLAVLFLAVLKSKKWGNKLPCSWCVVCWCACTILEGFSEDNYFQHSSLQHHRTAHHKSWHSLKGSKRHHGIWHPRANFFNKENSHRSTSCDKSIFLRCSQLVWITPHLIPFKTTISSFFLYIPELRNSMAQLVLLTS